MHSSVPEQWFLSQVDAVRRCVADAAWLQTWPELRDLLLQEFHSQPAWLLSLPVAACLSVGGTQEDGVRVAAGWMAMNRAAHLLDAVEDGDPLPDEMAGNPRKATNYSTALIHAAFRFVLELHSPERARHVVRIFSECGFQAAHGQQIGFELAGLSGEEALAEYWHAVILKSGSLMQMAAAGGAAAGTDDPQGGEALGSYGVSLGVILQILDDCRDMLRGAAPVPAGAPAQTVETSLPGLLFALKTNTSLADAARTPERWHEALNAAGVPQIVAEVLARWQQSAESNLEALAPSTALDVLRSIPRKVLQP